MVSGHVQSPLLNQSPTISPLSPNLEQDLSESSLKNKSKTEAADVDGLTIESRLAEDSRFHLN